MNNQEPTVNIELLDTTLRDGAQSLPKENQFPRKSKPEIADQIASLGVSVIEAGFPSNKKDFKKVRNVARTIGNRKYDANQWYNSESTDITQREVVISGLSRALPQDIEKSWEALHYAKRPRIHTFIATDGEHMAAKFPDKTPSDVLSMVRFAVEYARELADSHYNGQATVEFSAEAATTSDLNFLEKVIKTAIDAGADVINVPDTVGQRSTLKMQVFYKKIIDWIMETNPNVIISAHNHNDLGLAEANTLALVSSACIYSALNDKSINLQLETTICGLGERAGNADLFPVVAQLFKFSEDFPSNLTWEFNPENSVRVANFVMNKAGLIVDRQNPIVGQDTIKHRSGIHIDGILKGGHRIYTPYDPVFWGHKANAEFEEGDYQGKNSKLLLSKSKA